MSSVFDSDNLSKDFLAFESALVKTNAFTHVITDRDRPILKKHHRLVYSIALLENKLEEKWESPNRFLFLNEILSDLLSNVSISYLGFFYSSKILIRRIIENLYNHIYYFEHPVEYELLNLGRNEYSAILSLKEYLESHPRIKSLHDKNIKTHNDILLQNYQELCRTVHTKGEDFMGLAKNLEEIKPTFDIEKHLESLNRIIQSMIYILYKFHQEIALANTELTIVSKAFPKDERKDLLS